MKNIIKYELYKIFSKKVLLFAAIFFVAVIFLYESISFAYGNLNDFYNEYYSGKEGAVSQSEQKKASEFLENNEFTLTNNAEKNIKIYRDNKYYSDVNRANQAAINELSRRDVLLSHNNTMAQKYGKESYEYRYGELHAKMQSKLVLPGLYFTRPWENPIDFPNNMGLVILTAMLLLGLSPIFSQEFSCGTDSLILTSKKGKREVTAAKVLASVIYSASVCVFFFGLLFIINAVKSGVSGAASPIQQINKYVNSPFDFTLLQYYLIEMAVLIFISVCFGLLVMFISSISKNSLVPFFICGLVAAVPALYRVMNLNLTGFVGKIFDNILNFSYSEVMRVSPLFSKFKAYDIFGFPVLSCFVIPLFFLVITVIFVILTHKCFEKHQVN